MEIRYFEMESRLMDVPEDGHRPQTPLEPGGGTQPWSLLSCQQVLCSLGKLCTGEARR